MPQDVSQASALSRLFSASVVRDLLNGARSPAFVRLLHQARMVSRVSPDSTVGNAFDEAFKCLRRVDLRDEYVYRSAITQKILLGKHSLSTATMLREARAGSSKADVVVLNGTSTAYEIKSERDSLVRMRNQLHNYRRVFASVNVLASAGHLREVLDSAPADVGVITLSPRFTLQTIREPQNAPDRISPLMILETLRLEEAQAILENLSLEMPDVPNTRMRLELRRIFAALDPTVVHDEMVRVLRSSRSQFHLTDYIRTIPVSLRAAALGMRPDVRGRMRFKEAIETPLAEALAWK